MITQQMAEKSESFSMAQNAQKPRVEWVLQDKKVHFTLLVKYEYAA